MAWLQGVKIRWIAAGPAAAHCLAGDMDGKIYSWGRNEVICKQEYECIAVSVSAKFYLFAMQKGQLGHGDTMQRNVPSAIAALAKETIVGGK